MRKLYAIIAEQDAVISLSSNLDGIIEEFNKRSPLDPIGICEVKQKSWNTNIFEYDSIIEKMVELSEIDSEWNNTDDDFYRLSEDTQKSLEERLEQVLESWLKEVDIKTREYEIVKHLSYDERK